MEPSETAGTFDTAESLRRSRQRAGTPCLSSVRGPADLEAVTHQLCQAYDNVRADEVPFRAEADAHEGEHVALGTQIAGADRTEGGRLGKTCP